MSITAILPARADSTAYRAEDEAISRARAVLALAGTVTGEAAEAAGAVEDAIETHEALRAGVLCWEAYDSDLREYAEQARHSIAVEKSAQDAEQRADYLAEVIDRYAAQLETSGEQAASAAIKGES